VHHTPVPLADLDAVRAAITGQTRLIWVETPTNPLLSIADIPAIVEVAGASGVKVLVDNTFASPALQQPLTLGADIVLHSTTKYIGGHSDVVGGALVTDDEELDARFGFLQNGAGAVPGPFDAYLTMRGLKTLELRMQRHCENAAVSPRSWPTTPRSARCSTRACRAIPATTSPPGRCADSAA
jgi:cystathionine gamma-synthase